MAKKSPKAASAVASPTILPKSKPREPDEAILDVADVATDSIGQSEPAIVAVSPQLWRAVVGVTLTIYAIFQIFYVTATPLQEINLPDNLPTRRADKPMRVGIGPDEKEHFLYIVSLAHRNRIPAPLPRYRKAVNGNIYQARDKVTAPPPPYSQTSEDYVSYQAQHPPLFYAIGSLVYKLAGFEDSPLVWYLLRGLCALCGAFTIVFTACAARDAFPDRATHLLAAPFAAFLPIFGFMHGPISNEPLALALGAFVWWKTIGFLRRDSIPAPKEILIAGLVLGLALATRLTTAIFVMPFLYAVVRRGGVRGLVLGGLLPAVPLVTLALLNFANYGTPLLRTFYRPAVGLYAIDANFFRETLLWYNATAWYPHWLTQFYLPGATTDGKIVDNRIMTLPLLVNVVLSLLLMRNLRLLSAGEKRVVGAATFVVLFCIAATFQQQMFSDWNVIFSAGRYLVSALPAAVLLVVVALTPPVAARNKSVSVARAIVGGVAVVMLLLNLLFVNLVRRFYADHPTQPAVQKIEATTSNAP